MRGFWYPVRSPETGFKYWPFTWILYLNTSALSIKIIININISKYFIITGIHVDQALILDHGLYIDHVPFQEPVI